MLYENKKKKEGKFREFQDFENMQNRWFLFKLLISYLNKRGRSVYCIYRRAFL